MGGGRGLKKGGIIKIVVAVVLISIAVITITVARQIRRHQFEVWSTVYLDLNYVRRFRLKNNEYSYEGLIGEHNHNLTTHIDEYTRVTFTLDENYTPEKGELFFYPSEHTQIVIDKMNEYIEDEGPIEGYDGIHQIVTAEDVVMHKDTVQKIIDSMSVEESEDIFS